MLKIYIPAKAKQGTGGGWTFTSNLIKALKDKVQFVENWQDCDVYFIPGCTLTEREEVKQAKEKGKRIVLRIDGVPRNSRNRNTGTSRLFDMAQMADEVIYQSNWSREFIITFIKKDGVVILNGVDTDIFREDGRRIEKEGNVQCLYSRFNRDETKRWEKAWYDFQKVFFINPRAHLWIVGKFSPEQKEYNFDFFGGAEKRYTYFGVVEDKEKMAKIYRGADILLCPYSNESCSNVVNEAMACGLKVSCADLNDAGGIDQQISTGVITLEQMGDKYMEVFKKVASNN